jgi:hypothetical protein
MKASSGRANPVKPSWSAKGDTNKALITAPIVVPIGSVRAAKSLFQRYLWITPTISAPGIPPGNANIVPVPKAFRMIAATTATSVAYHGPKSTPPTPFIICWAGYTLVGPIGKDRGDRTIAVAARTAVTAAFLEGGLYHFLSTTINPRDCVEVFLL